MVAVVSMSSIPCETAILSIQARSLPPSVLRQSEDRAGLDAQHVLAERDQCRCRLRRDGARDQHVVAHGLAQSFEPADQIDGGADRGEVQPVGGADIAQGLPNRPQL